MLEEEIGYPPVFRTYDQYRDFKPHANIQKLDKLEQSSNCIVL